MSALSKMEQYKFESLNMLLPKALDEVEVNLEYLLYNVMFLKEVFQDLLKGADILKQAVKIPEFVHAYGDMEPGIIEFLEKGDLDHLATEVPDAFNDCLDGVRQLMRSAAGIRGLTEDGERKKTFINLNEVLINLILTLKQEWHSKAQIAMNLDRNIQPFPAVKSDLHHALSKMLSVHVPVPEVMVGSASNNGKVILSVRTRGLEAYNEVRISTKVESSAESLKLDLWKKGLEKDLVFLEWIIVSEHDGELDIWNASHGEYESTIRLPVC